MRAGHLALPIRREIRASMESGMVLRLWRMTASC
jgi:hypothetical protein